jgi:alkylation response protein AidB-like acyl-CoA dehydrogenase
MAAGAADGPNQLAAEQILANARTMAPPIAARSQEIEQLRRLPEDLVADLRDAGFFRMGRSRANGGPQMSLPQHLEVIEVLAEADPSVGWCVKIGTDSGIIAELLPPAASARLLPYADMVTAGQFTAGRGRLQRADGGYILNGRFPFGSGVTHADVVMSGAMLFDESGAPVIGPDGMLESRLAFCRADDVFIPEDQALRIDESLFEGREPLYSSGFNWVTTMAAVPLGTARRALDEGKALVAQRTGGIPSQPMARLPHVQEAIAEAETLYGAARAFLYAAANEFWAELERGAPSVETKGRLALANVNSFRMAAQVTRQLFDLIGANAVFEGQPLERLARDALTLNQHMIIARPALASYGAMVLGVEHPSPLY